jgi:hypothetical protein
VEQRFVVVAMIRKDMTERIVAFFRHREDAVRTARRYAAVHSGRFIRFLVRPMDLSASQVEAIVFEWGRDDAASGEPLRAERMPKPYDASYRRGYRAGKKLTSRRRNA